MISPDTIARIKDLMKGGFAAPVMPEGTSFAPKAEETAPPDLHFATVIKGEGADPAAVVFDAAAAAKKRNADVKRGMYSEIHSRKSDEYYGKKRYYYHRFTL